MNNKIYGSTTTTPVPLVSVDQNYDPESKNAQSGKAVAEAIENMGGGGNVDLTDYVKNTDYATFDKAGVVKVSNNSSGLIMLNGKLLIASATDNDIKTRASDYRPITSAAIDYAVKVGVTTNIIELTEEEKTAACEWLGVNALVGDIETALDNIIAIQENLIGGGSV